MFKKKDFLMIQSLDRHHTSTTTSTDFSHYSTFFILSYDFTCLSLMVAIDGDGECLLIFSLAPRVIWWSLSNLTKESDGVWYGMIGFIKPFIYSSTTHISYLNSLHQKIYITCSWTDRCLQDLHWLLLLPVNLNRDIIQTLNGLSV